MSMTFFDIFEVSKCQPKQKKKQKKKKDRIFTTNIARCPSTIHHPN